MDEKQFPSNNIMRYAIHTLVVLALVGFSPAIMAAKPNVILLLADDLGWKDIGCYGGPAKTPVLDRLAQSGIRFTDFHSPSGVCSPSRATTLTGRHHIRAGVYSVIMEDMHKTHLLKREITIPEHLKKSGYTTAHFGKWHLGFATRTNKKPTISEHGFDYWFGTGVGANPSQRNPVNFVRNGKPVGKTTGYACQLIVDDAISWLDTRHKPGVPFFFNIWFHEPHAVTAAPEDIVTQYGKVTDAAAIYTGTIDNTDRAIGRLVAKLKEMNQFENTLIVYTSDNGSYRDDRNGGLRGKKGSTFEGGHRVPGIFHWPKGFKGGRVESETAGIVDFLPTLCGLLKIDPPENVHLDGADMTPFLTGKSTRIKRHQPLFWLRPSRGQAIVVRVGNYTLVGNLSYDYPNSGKRQQELLKEIKTILDNDPNYVPSDLTLWSRAFDGPFANPEAEKRRKIMTRLVRFDEASIPALKAATIANVELYDLSTDLNQTRNIASENPELTARLKKEAAAILTSVMEDAPTW